MLKAILIDDEPDCVRLLAHELAVHCPQVQVIGQTTSSEDGLRLIQVLQPDVVFLDIEMPRLNGFQLLEKLGSISFSLIFVTAYNEFAVKAFRFSALDYLLKPIDSEDLQEAVRKAERQQRIDARQVDILRSQLHSHQLADKIAVPYQQGIIFLPINEVIYCESDSNYTKVVATQNRHYLLTRTLREVQEVLEERNFLRVHRQYVINLDHIKLFMKGEGAYLVMTNDVSIPVARNQKEKLVQRFGWL
ncbi:LytR/AlgR family response regulator transcription factor [Spirosoma panaciterrae]|uniref:LytR/AlgR family response regulator transcription factor n=1 Tax=Spirosoma panaciterrae TaxID=496058 RepID=UPI000594DD73|nr:LytTR family DNA-binding domain-containing protein [Spirosoma panaciterrae]